MQHAPPTRQHQTHESLDLQLSFFTGKFFSRNLAKTHNHVLVHVSSNVLQTTDLEEVRNDSANVMPC